MTAARLRQVSAWTTATLIALIVSPADGDSLSRMLPGSVPLIGGEAGYDTCLGGIDCEDGHALAFAALGVSISTQMIAGRRGARALAAAARALLLLAAFAMASELAQGWSGRDASVEDWLADMAGAFLGVVVGSELARFLVQEQPEG
jgi:hypothetical protein